MSPSVGESLVPPYNVIPGSWLLWHVMCCPAGGKKTCVNASAILESRLPLSSSRHRMVVRSPQRSQSLRLQLSGRPRPRPAAVAAREVKGSGGEMSQTRTEESSNGQGDKKRQLVAWKGEVAGVTLGNGERGSERKAKGSGWRFGENEEEEAAAGSFQLQRKPTTKTQISNSRQPVGRSSFSPASLLPSSSRRANYKLEYLMPSFVARGKHTPAASSYRRPWKPAAMWVPPSWHASDVKVWRVEVDRGGPDTSRHHSLGHCVLKSKSPRILSAKYH